MAENLQQGVTITSVGAHKTVRRRTTFSISPEHMQEAQRSFRESIAIVDEKQPSFGDLQSNFKQRRDSAVAIDLDDDDDVLPPPPAKPDTDYTPHEIDAQDYMDKVLRGKIKFPPVREKRIPLSDEVKKRVAEKAARMPQDGVLMVKSDMDQVATLALPDDIKT